MPTHAPSSLLPLLPLTPNARGSNSCISNLRWQKRLTKVKTHLREFTWRESSFGEKLLLLHLLKGSCFSPQLCLWNAFSLFSFHHVLYFSPLASPFSRTLNFSSRHLPGPPLHRLRPCPCWHTLTSSSLPNRNAPFLPLYGHPIDAESSDAKGHTSTTQKGGGGAFNPQDRRKTGLIGKFLSSLTQRIYWVIEDILKYSPRHTFLRHTLYGFLEDGPMRWSYPSCTKWQLVCKWILIWLYFFLCIRTQTKIW